ncbi:MAG: transposase [Marinifilaceae bacterium]
MIMDSWFTSLSFIKDIRNIKKQNIHIIGYRSIFNYNDRQMNTKDICSSLSKWKRCRRLKLQYKTAVVELDEEKYILHYSRFNNQNKYRVFLSTDCRLSFIKTIKIYQNRWTIEVFFKEAKQLLNLGTCQANDFDANIPNITIVMIQYIIMSIRHRVDTYETK